MYKLRTRNGQVTTCYGLETDKYCTLQQTKMTDTNGLETDKQCTINGLETDKHVRTTDYKQINTLNPNH